MERDISPVSFATEPEDFFFSRVHRIAGKQNEKTPSVYDRDISLLDPEEEKEAIDTQCGTWNIVSQLLATVRGSSGKSLLGGPSIWQSKSNSCDKLASTRRGNQKWIVQKRLC